MYNRRMLSIVLYFILESKEDCVSSATGSEYTGNRTLTGDRCVPWKSVPYMADVYGPWFPDKSVEEAGFYCRNPDSRQTGPWCVSADTQRHVSCHIPHCGECKLKR